MKQLYYGNGKMHCQAPVVPLISPIVSFMQTYHTWLETQRYRNALFPEICTFHGIWGYFWSKSGWYDEAKNNYRIVDRVTPGLGPSVLYSFIICTTQVCRLACYPMSPIILVCLKQSLLSSPSWAPYAEQWLEGNEWWQIVTQEICDGKDKVHAEAKLTP